MRSIEKKHDVQASGVYYGDKAKQRLQQKLAKQFQEMWDNKAPKAYQGIPIQRHAYKQDGFEDDAMLLTHEFYDGFLKEYEGRTESEYHADLDYDEASPNMVGKKWIVVVDYHR